MGRIPRVFMAFALVSALLTMHAGSAVGQTKSTDGRIAFVVSSPAVKVALMDADGGNLVELDATESGSITDMRWSPDGRWIYFSAKAGGASGPADIYRIRPNGTGMQNLTNTPTIDEGAFDIHPRGKKIVFTENVNGRSIVTASITSGGLTNRTNLVSDGYNNDDPTYHPNGKIVAYVSPADGSWDIYTIHVPTTLIKNRTNDTETNFNPVFSPDGKKIAFEKNSDVWTMDVDGSNKNNVSDGIFTDGRPAWSTDGTLIYFVSNRTGITQMHVMTAGGADQTQIPSGDLWATHGDAQPIHKCFGKRVTKLGTLGNDTIIGTAGADVIVTFGGADTVKGMGGADRICTGKGSDTVFGGLGNDRIAGEAGTDELRGGAGADTIRGGTGGDTLFGGKGTDTLLGGPGNDTCQGGENLASCEG